VRPAWCVNVSVLLKSTGALQPTRHYYTIHFGDTDARKRLTEVIVDQKETNCRFDGILLLLLLLLFKNGCWIPSARALSKRGKMLLRTNSVNDWSPLVLPPALCLDDSSARGLDCCPTYAFLMVLTHTPNAAPAPMRPSIHSYTHTHTYASNRWDAISSSSTLDCPCCSSLLAVG
jgi:hypothetical protein